MAERLKIAFAGDVCFTGSFRKRLLNGEEIFAPDVLEKLHEQDFVVVNLEGPATNLPAKKTNGIALHSPPEAIPYLIERNFKVFNLANNHLFDHGLAGFEETIALIEKHGGMWFGAGHNINEASKPVELSAHGISRGLLGIAHNEGMIAGAHQPGVLCEDSYQQITQAIEHYQKTGKQLILNYHGGEEYTRYPAPGRRKRLECLAVNSQSWVVGHHSHTLQGVELVKGQSVFYSLGNFIFDLEMQSSRSFINDSAVLFTEFDEEGGHYSMLPININTVEGRIKLKPLDAFETEMAALSNWAAYEEMWLAEAHRVFWMTRSSGGSLCAGTEQGGGSKRSSGILSKLFKPSAWKAIWNMYRNPHTRPVALGALQYQLKNRGAGK